MAWTSVVFALVVWQLQFAHAFLQFPSHVDNDVGNIPLATRGLCGTASLYDHGSLMSASFCYNALASKNKVARLRLRGSTVELHATIPQAMEQQTDFLTYFDHLEIRTMPSDTDAHVQAVAESSALIQRVLDRHEKYETLMSMPEELGLFLLQSAESLARERGFKRLVVPPAVEENAVWTALEQIGFSQNGDGSFSKDVIGALLGAEDGRDGEKGLSELLTVISMQNQPIAVYPRRKVEEHNLLHPAIGVLVHNKKGEIYVHQRSPDKSMHGSFYDMFVGGLVLAAEAVPDAARNEVKEELGIEGKELEELFEVVWLGSKNRVVLRVYRVEAEDADVSYNDGEVVWGKFVPLAELESMMEERNFVPGGKKAWEETVKRGLHAKYLK